MPFNPLTWVDKVTKLGPTNINRIETGVADAHAGLLNAQAIDTAVIKDLAVTTGKLAAGAVTAAKITADTITAAEIAVNAVGAAELADNAVDTAAIQDGAVTNAKIVAGAGIPVSKIAPGVNGQWVETESGAVVWAGAYYRKRTEKDVVNTAVETDLLNDEITIAAGVMGTSRRIRAILEGDFLGNGTNGFTLRIKLGGTTIYDDASTVTQSAVRRGFRLEIDISNLGATNSQFMTGILALTNVGAATTGLGDISNLVNDATASALNRMGISSNGTHAIDSTIAMAFKVTVQWTTASINNSFRLKTADIEVR